MSNLSNFPKTLDTNVNLYHVSDGLRVVLAEDYNPGDTTITVIGDEETMRRFTPTGIITLTEQCSEAELRAISFSYTNRTLTQFLGCTILAGFTDVVKPKGITHVTQNVMAQHHNALKDALSNIQGFVGIKGEVGTTPLEGTMEQRINYLRNIVLQPKAWFRANKQIGLAPMVVEFTNQSFRLGTDGTSQSVSYIWDFEYNPSVTPTTICNATSLVPSTVSHVLINDLDGGTITKTYYDPGVYSVKLTVINDFGSDSVIFDDYIQARYPAPLDACIEFVQRGDQQVTQGTNPTGGPYDQPNSTTPVIRSVVNSIIDMYIKDTATYGANPNTISMDHPYGYSYAGEELDGVTAIDPIIQYTWSLADDIPHSNAPSARAVYSIGGLYDLVLRCDTSFGSYKITKYPNAFDIVEKINLWLWTENPLNPLEISVSEFGLLSETFKYKAAPQVIVRNSSFLEDDPLIPYTVPNKIQQKREFLKNVGFAQATSATSGYKGSGLLYWASGRSPLDSPASETIEFTSFNGLEYSYTTSPVTITRPWNWLSFASTSQLFFILGGVTDSIPAGTSPTNQTRSLVDLGTSSVDNSYTFGVANYKNGADELRENEVSYTGGLPDQGHMSVYRSTWSNDAGYFLRNEGVGTFFRMKSFYKTSGVFGDLVQDIQKIQDMSGASRVEGQLVTMSQGVYFFSNSGAVSAYNPTSGVWGTGGPGVNSPAFRALQDTNVIGYDNPDQTLFCASDGDKVAYLSFDYSENAFIRFNETDTTFSSVSSRPSGTQFNMTIF